MPLMFYPNSDDTQKGSFEDRIDVMRDAAERLKAIILDPAAHPEHAQKQDSGNGSFGPLDLTAVFNWEEIAILLREVRELPESNEGEKHKKAALLTKLAEVYEILRSAKMTKLEAVRIALVSEANQLTGGTTQNVT